MELFLTILAYSCILPLVYVATIVWFCQFAGSLFYTFPIVLGEFFKGELNSIKPVFIALSPVCFWLLIIFFINFIFFMFWNNAFIYFYTHKGVLIAIGFAIFQCIFQIGNQEMTDYTNKLINDYKK